MFRLLLAATVATIIASAATAQTIAPVVTPAPPPGPSYPPGTVIQYPASTVIEYPDKTVFTSPPVYQRPAIGLGAASSPFYFASEWGIGGPGYAYRGYPPYNGWSGGYRGAYYGSPVPAYSYPRRWR